MHDRSYRGGCTRTVSFALVLLFPAFAFAAMQDRVNDETVRALRGPLAQTARVRLQRFPVAGVPETLDLERFEVWAPDAKIITEGNGVQTRLPVPTTRFFRGSIVGQPDSMVFLAVDEGVAGLIISDDRRYNVHSTARAMRGGKQPGTDVFVNEEFDALDHPEGFHCSTEEQMITPPKGARHVSQTEAIRDLIPVAQNGALNSPTATHTLNLALEADSKLNTNMGGPTNVTTFIGNLVGAASTIYQRDLQTDLVVVFTRIQTNPVTDPFVYPNGSTILDADALAQLGDIWHSTPPSTTPHSSVVRLSGNSITSGIAWIKTSCSPDFHCGSPDPSCGDPKLDGHYGGEYAYCGGLGSTLTVADPNATPPSSTSLFWPLLEFSHELGHVQAANHTHCIALNSTDWAAWPAASGRPWVDLCFGSESGCYSGATSVPPEKGTIMSYCHNLGGGTQTRYIFGKSTEPNAKVIHGNMGGGLVPNGGILPYLISVTPDSPVILAPASVSTGAPNSASINGPVASLTYDWTITNGTIVGPTTGSSITFTGTANPATLRVRGTINTPPATQGCAASDYMTITVNTACVAPAITGQPAGTSINQGQSVMLSVTATGTSLLYQWYVGSPPTITNPVPGATSSSVTVGPGSTTTYWVQVSNGCGTANSNAATVTVTPTATTAKFYLLPAPCRILDTRGGGAIAANSVRNVVVVGLCSLPSGITAIASNVTVVSPTAEAYATVYPGPVGSARPFASTINYSSGRTLANNANARVAADGSINIFNSGSAPLDFLIDVDGYFK